jgi:hypothetical protein
MPDGVYVLADEWEEYLFAADEVKPWIDNGFVDPYKAAAWRDAGFDVEDARKIKLVPPSLAVMFRDNGFSVDDTAHWRALCMYTGFVTEEDAFARPDVSLKEALVLYREKYGDTPVAVASRLAEKKWEKRMARYKTKRRLASSRRKHS